MEMRDVVAQLKSLKEIKRQLRKKINILSSYKGSEYYGR
jgi:hypothetical protein